MVMTEPKRDVRMPREAGNRSHDLCTDYALKKSSKRVKTAFDGSNHVSNETPSKAKTLAP